MKATFSILILLTVFLGFAMVGGAIAQPIDGGPESSEAAPAATETSATAPTETAATGAEDAPPAATAPEKPLDQGKGLYTSVKGGEWLLAFGFLGMLLGSLSRFVIGRKWDFIKSKTGGYLISAGVGMGTLGGLIIEAGAFSMSMLPTAITATLAAMAMHGPAKALKKKMTGESGAEAEA